MWGIFYVPKLRLGMWRCVVAGCKLVETTVGSLTCAQKPTRRPTEVGIKSASFGTAEQPLAFEPPRRVSFRRGAFYEHDKSIVSHLLHAL